MSEQDIDKAKDELRAAFDHLIGRL